MVSTSDCGSEDAGSIPAGHIIYTMGIMTPKKYGAILRYRKGHTKQRLRERKSDEYNES